MMGGAAAAAGWSAGGAGSGGADACREGVELDDEGEAVGDVADVGRWLADEDIAEGGAAGEEDVAAPAAEERMDEEDLEPAAVVPARGGARAAAHSATDAAEGRLQALFTGMLEHGGLTVSTLAIRQGTRRLIGPWTSQWFLGWLRLRGCV